jgi:cytochrome c peroxidase
MDHYPSAECRRDPRGLEHYDARSGELETIVEPNSQATAEVPPIPPGGPMAPPKSLDQVGLPLDAVRATVPVDNQQTPEKVALGEKLFFDGRLSVDGTVACSTCHDPARAFSDGREGSIGVKGHARQRNAPTILNPDFRYLSELPI